MKYNPFKMWGSWVGAVLAIVIHYILLFSIGDCFESCQGFIGAITDLITPSGFLGLSIMTGFLIGWGIHSLIRRLRNK